MKKTSKENMQINIFLLSQFHLHWWRVLRECGSVGLLLSANLRGIKDSVPPPDSREGPFKKRNRAENSSKVNAVQFDRKWETGWLAIPECQVLAIARGLLPSLACQLISGRCNLTSFQYNLLGEIFSYSQYIPRGDRELLLHRCSGKIVTIWPTSKIDGKQEAQNVNKT